MALANSELDELNELALWDRLAIQLRESALAQGRPATPPATPTRSNDGAPAATPAWDLWPPSPQPPAQATAWPQLPQPALPPPPSAYQLPWPTLEFIDLRVTAIGRVANAKVPKKKRTTEKKVTQTKKHNNRWTVMRAKTSQQATAAARVAAEMALEIHAKANTLLGLSPTVDEAKLMIKREGISGHVQASSMSSISSHATRPPLQRQPSLFPLATPCPAMQAYYAMHDEVYIDAMLYGGEFLPVDGIGTKTQTQGCDNDGEPLFSQIGQTMDQDTLVLDDAEGEDVGFEEGQAKVRAEDTGDGKNKDKTLLDTTCSGSFTSNKEEFKRDLLDRIKENAEDWENDKGYADKPPFKPLPLKEGSEEREEEKKKKGTKKKKKKKKKENKKKEVTAYPRVNEITLGNRKYVAPNDYCDNESEYDDLPMPFTYISDHDLNEHTTFDITNLWETNSDSSHNDIESSKLGEEVFENPFATGHYVLDTSPSNNNDGSFQGSREEDDILRSRRTKSLSLGMPRFIPAYFKKTQASKLGDAQGIPFFIDKVSGSFS
ncbi:hypothetical protein QYE76_007320 [Lolium multiflorum]|uniref:Uncharacterized protein n=1 Tax=Lolium multiflorum TaxID=4521 RepID=A0AAD8RWD5_LOLMU|nr:hypothetical protein QYE76_007320 [Lolium multiflorum]